MFGENKLTLWVMTGLLAVTTVFFNVYIFLMGLWNFKQKKQKAPCDIIIMALSVADVAHQMVCYLWMTMDEMDSKCLIGQKPYAVMLVLIFSFKFTIMWDTSFLTFYYSTKLVSTPNHCYTQIQAAILRHVTLIILIIPVCGLGTCMPMLAVFRAENDTITDGDCGILLPDGYSAKIYQVIYLLLTDVVPGLLMMKCCISISVHLAIHLQHMKASTNGSHAPKLGSQMRVIQMALSLVAVFILFLVVDLYVHYQIAVYHNNDIVLAFFFTSLYTSITAVVLIYGKKTFWKALIREFNISLYPCLSCLKVPEQKAKPEKVQN